MIACVRLCLRPKPLGLVVALVLTGARVSTAEAAPLHYLAIPPRLAGKIVAALGDFSDLGSLAPAPRWCITQTLRASAVPRRCY